MKTKKHFGQYLGHDYPLIPCDSEQYTELHGFPCGKCGVKVHPHKAYFNPQDEKQYHLDCHPDHNK